MGQADQCAFRCLPGGLGARFAEGVGQLFVRIAHLDAADDGFTLFGPEPSQRLLVPFDRFAPDRLFERGQAAIDLEPIELADIRPPRLFSQIVSNVVEDSLAEVRLQGAGTANLHGVQALERLEQCVLDQVIGVFRIARPGREPAASPPLQRRQVPGHEPVQRAGIALMRTLDEAESRLAAERVRVARSSGYGIRAVVRHDAADCSRVRARQCLLCDQ